MAGSSRRLPHTVEWYPRGICALKPDWSVWMVGFDSNPSYRTWVTCWAERLGILLDWCWSAGGTYGIGGHLTTLPLLHSLSLKSPSRVPLTLFPLMIAFRRGGVPKIRHFQLLLGGDLMIQPNGSLGNPAESKILDVVIDSYIDESSDQANGYSEQRKKRLLQMQRSGDERGFVNKVSWAVCWQRR